MNVVPYFCDLKLSGRQTERRSEGVSRRRRQRQRRKGDHVEKISLSMKPWPR